MLTSPLSLLTSCSCFYSRLPIKRCKPSLLDRPTHSLSSLNSLQDQKCEACTCRQPEIKLLLVICAYSVTDKFSILQLMSKTVTAQLAESQKNLFVHVRKNPNRPIHTIIRIAKLVEEICMQREGKELKKT